MGITGPLPGWILPRCGGGITNWWLVVSLFWGV